MSPTVTMFGEPVTDQATVADREGFLTDGYTPLNCGTCGVAVQVRKNSREQTSIQWCGSARDCSVFAADGAGSALRATCPRLMESITRAAKLGAVPVPSEADASAVDRPNTVAHTTVSHTTPNADSPDTD